MANPTLAEMQAAGMTPEQISQALAMISAGLSMPSPVQQYGTISPAQGRAIVQAGTIGAAPVARNHLLQAQTNAAFSSGQLGFVSTDRVDRINLEFAVQQIHAFVAQCKTPNGNVNITRFMSEEQMIAELERNIGKARSAPVQGTSDISKLGNVEVQRVVLPSGRTWDANKKGIDPTAISQAPNSFAF